MQNTPRWEPIVAEELSNQKTMIQELTTQMGKLQIASKEKKVPSVIEVGDGTIIVMNSSLVGKTSNKATVADENWKKD